MKVIKIVTTISNEVVNRSISYNDYIKSMVGENLLARFVPNIEDRSIIAFKQTLTNSKTNLEHVMIITDESMDQIMTIIDGIKTAAGSEIFLSSSTFDMSHEEIINFLNTETSDDHRLQIYDFSIF